MGTAPPSDARLQVISDSIRVIPDFPKVRQPPLKKGEAPTRWIAPTTPPVCAAAKPCARRPPPPHVQQPGIQFQDVTTILLNPTAFKHCIDLLVERYQGQHVDVVAGGWVTSRDDHSHAHPPQPPVGCSALLRARHTRAAHPRTHARVLTASNRV